MLELFAYDFLRNAVLVGLLASVLCGIVGTFVVVKRLVFLAGGVAHAAFGGLGVAYFLGADPRVGAAITAVLAGLALANPARAGALRSTRGRSDDALIGILWAAGMAFGVVFLAKVPGYAPNLMAYLFGDILTVRTVDVFLALGAVIMVALFFLLFFKESVAVAFDEEYAAVQGVPVRRVRIVLMLLTALSVVFLLQLVGLILVIALLTIPPVIALRLATSFPAVIALAVAVGAVITEGGLALAYVYDLPAGPTIVLLGVALLLLVDLARRAGGRGRADA